MRSGKKFVVMGAAAVLCLSAVAVRPAAATTVTVQSLTWEFYQGGYAQSDPHTFDMAQGTVFDVPSRTVSITVGGATFSSIASIQHSTLNDSSGFVFSSVATLRAEASVNADTPEGLANAFSGLSLYSVVFEVSDAPMMYLGSEPLDGAEGPIFSGDLVQPGMYEFFYFNPMGIDASTEAFPGQSTFDEVTRNFNFEFVVPTPGTAALALPTLTLLARRARRR